MNAAAQRRAAVIGLGLMGASVGLGLRLGRRGPSYRVAGWDADPARLRQAAQMGAVDAAARDLAEAVRDAELVVAAVPAEVVADVLLAASPLARREAVFTDVASVKLAIVQRLGERLPGGQWFVGGHPMAGSDRAGPAGADPYLFENAVYVLTPLPGVAGEAVERVREMVGALGAQALVMAPDEHDRAAAATSHLPHLVAACLVLAAQQAREQGVPVGQMAATGFRDATRLALGHESVWEPIFTLNRQAVAEALTVFRKALEQAERALSTGDGQALRQVLERARAVRASLPFHPKGYGFPLHDLVVRVQDRPGAIYEVTGVLARAGVNVADIEILRAREGEAGTLRLGFDSRAQMERAGRLLQEAGWMVWER